MILSNFNNLDKEWPLVQSVEFDSDIINNILQNLHNKYKEKLTKEQKQVQIRYIKTQKSLQFLLSQGYDINCFLDKTIDEILESLEHSNSNDSLWERKKK